MTKTSVSMMASESLVSALLEAVAAVPDLAASKPILAESVPSSYRSPFGMSPDELLAVLKAVSLVFSTGTAMLTFVDKLLDVIRKHRQSVVLTHPRDPKQQLTVAPETAPETVKAWLERVK